MCLLKMVKMLHCYVLHFESLKAADFWITHFVINFDCLPNLSKLRAHIDETFDVKWVQLESLITAFVCFLLADNVTCHNIHCQDRQQCLLDVEAGRPRCVACSASCRPKFLHGPVCGTNNSTYQTWCHMMQDACSKGYVIDTKHSGKCVSFSISVSENAWIVPNRNLAELAYFRIAELVIRVRIKTRKWFNKSLKKQSDTSPWDTCCFPNWTDTWTIISYF